MTFPPYFAKVGKARFWYSEKAAGAFTLCMAPITYAAMSASKFKVRFKTEVILIMSEDDV